MRAWTQDLSISTYVPSQAPRESVCVREREKERERESERESACGERQLLLWVSGVVSWVWGPTARMFPVDGPRARRGVR